MNRYTLESLAMLGYAELENEEPEEDDIARVKAAGLYCPPQEQTHDEMVARVHAARDAVTQTGVVDAFLYSLESRQLEYRSALGSYALARNFPEHGYEHHSELPNGRCRVCGCQPTERVYTHAWNFQRYKFGGGHDEACFVAIDLERFAELPVMKPTVAGVVMLGNILRTARELPAQFAAGDLGRELATCFLSTNTERQALMAILGFCNIFQPEDCPGYLHGYPCFEDREDDSSGFADWGYPLSFWRGDGVVEEAAAYWFPMLA